MHLVRAVCDEWHAAKLQLGVVFDGYLFRAVSDSPSRPRGVYRAENRCVQFSPTELQTKRVSYLSGSVRGREIQGLVLALTCVSL